MRPQSDLSVVRETHPRVLRARAARALRGMRHVRGWGRLVNWLVPFDTAGAFVVRNEGVTFAGDLGSFLDRQTYLFGQYEEQSIDLFLRCVPRNRRRVVLDVGANVGTHTLPFARSFAQVHSFEPNPALWPAFNRNRALNRFDNVSLHPVGLGDRDDVLPFHAIDAANHGLGTFSTVEQYAQPLRHVAMCRLAIGDAYLQSQNIGLIDAVKVDVQGLEIAVIRGLRECLQRNQPFVWFELGEGTHRELRSRREVLELFPYPGRLLHLVESRSPVRHGARLEPVDGDRLPLGDYFVVPTHSQEPETGEGQTRTVALPVS
jgi:FkbM family methyltransferase